MGLTLELRIRDFMLNSGMNFIKIGIVIVSLT